MGEKMKDIMGFIFITLIGVIPTASLLYAIIVDVKADKIGYAVADLFVPPIGVIRGILLFFGII